MSGKRLVKEMFPQARKLEEQKVQFSPLCLIITVVNDGQGPAIMKIMDSCGASTSFGFHGQGTAENNFYEVFGLQNADKQIVLTPIRADIWPIVKQRINARFGVSRVAKGISFVLRINSIIGTYAYRYVANERIPNAAKGGKNQMDEIQMNENYEVVFSIVNDGYSDLVMDAARAVGARGGTVIHGRGTGNKDMEKFFGISITPEKQIVIILVPKEIKAEVLTAIYKAAGLNSKGQGIAFSVPASDVVGLVDVKEQDENK